MLVTDTAHCSNLLDFYLESRHQLEEAHGKEYCNYHDAIQTYTFPGVRYKELGIFQGTSAAAACLMKPISVDLIDQTMKWFNPNRAHFEKYCSDHNIVLSVIECSSIDPASVSWADVLLVDSRHTVGHVKQELAIHAAYTRRHMIFHDTSKPSDALFVLLHEWTQDHKEWRIIERNELGQGYTVLARI